ncbi:LOW QUALITY PROTEIN: hypothetical protein BC936DRAFT_148316, partial [Jimgerdemannia flammicorona]
LWLILVDPPKHGPTHHRPSRLLARSENRGSCHSPSQHCCLHRQNISPLPPIGQPSANPSARLEGIMQRGSSKPFIPTVTRCLTPEPAMEYASLTWFFVVAVAITAHDAIRSLINLSSDQNVCKELNDEKFIKHLTLLITQHCSCAVTNIPLASTDERFQSLSLPTWRACFFLISQSTSPFAREFLTLLRSLWRVCRHRSDHLVDAFVKGVDKAYNPEAEFHFLASVFANLTSLPKGRFAFIDKAKYDNLSPLNKLVCFTEHQNIIRRGGVISTIKNVTFETLRHKALLDPTGINILPFILLPLCGPEEFDLDVCIFAYSLA